MDRQQTDFLGVGWSLPIALDANGQVRPVQYEECVRQSIWMILGTARGERVMRPDFGCGIHDLAFAVNSAATAGIVISHVRQALVLWEPRIELLNVAAAADAAQPGRLLIDIDYQIRSTNSRFNLVYPFYLE